MLRTSPAALASHHFQEPLGNPEFDVFYHASVLIVISGVGGESMGCLRRWVGNMLDRVCAGLAWNAGREGGTEPSGHLRTRLPPIIGGHPKISGPIDFQE